MRSLVRNHHKPGRPPEIYPPEKIWNMLIMLSKGKSKAAVGRYFKVTRQYVLYIARRWSEDLDRLKKANS